ncbi:MAG: UbiA family prenyltransferase [Melioribacteraceae bacterium]|nr:UbiA family prenyltransferase [Melioribacteraceae bacterium]
MANTVSIFSIGFLRSYIITMRSYLLFISGITGLAGMSFAAEISNIEAVVLFLAFFLSYGFGQALTDCFQTDTDSISSPYRPLVKGLINRNDVLIVSLSGLVTCSIVFIYFSLINLLFTILAVIGLATYTYFKRKWWSGPFYNAWIVAVLFFIGYNSALKNNSIYISNSIAAAMLAVFFGYANFVLTGYFKDVNADRQTGYNTLLVKF